MAFLLIDFIHLCSLLPHDALLPSFAIVFFMEKEGEQVHDPRVYVLSQPSDLPTFHEEMAIISVVSTQTHTQYALFVYYYIEGR